MLYVIQQRGVQSSETPLDPPLANNSQLQAALYPVNTGHAVNWHDLHRALPVYSAYNTVECCAEGLHY